MPNSSEGRKTVIEQDLEQLIEQDLEQHIFNTDKLKLGLSVSTLVTLVLGIATFVSFAVNSKRDIADQIREATSARDSQFQQAMKAQEDKYRADDEQNRQTLFEFGKLLDRVSVRLETAAENLSRVDSRSSANDTRIGQLSDRLSRIEAELDYLKKGK